LSKKFLCYCEASFLTHDSQKLESKISELQELCNETHQVGRAASIRMDSAINHNDWQDDAKFQNQIQKLKSSWNIEQDMRIREVEETKASVVSERIE
jgi:hypothetical protein